MRYFFLLALLFTGIFCWAQEERTELVLERINGFSSSDRIEDIRVNGPNVFFAGKKGISSINNSSSSLTEIIVSNNAVAVKVSKKGNVFSAFKDGKIYMNDRFLYHIDKEGIEINDLEVYKTKLWVATNQGIYTFNIKTGKYITKYDSNNSKLKSDIVSFIRLFESLDKLWIGTDQGIMVVEDDKKWKLSNTKEKFIAATQNIDGLWLLSDKELWLVYEDYGRDRWQEQGLRKGLYEGKVNDLALDNEDNLYIASDILTRYNPYKNKLEKYGENLGLVASKCLSLASDDQGALWLGTEDAGLFRIYKDQMEIKQMVITTFLENPISCPGGSDGSIVVEVQGGAEPYKYFWERARLKGETNPKDLKAGNYKVTVEDFFGARQYASINIEDPFPITMNVIETNAVTKAGKKDGTAKVSFNGGTPPYEVLWDNSERGLTPRKLSHGDHELTVTDSKGCTLVSNISISKPKLLPDLDITKIEVGQTLRINNLYFASNSIEINPESNEVLSEVYDFLDDNKNVFIEIGGHTNNLPQDEFCDSLSTSRAKSVADYLYTRGVPKDRIKYKGYGKRNPIASNKSKQGRQRNQRVEIKILRVEG